MLIAQVGVALALIVAGARLLAAASAALGLPPGAVSLLETLALRGI